MLLNPTAVADCLADAPLPWLGGLRASEFLRDYWQKKPLLVRNAFPDLATLLEPDELLELAETEEAESRVIVEDGAEPWEVRQGPFHSTVWRKLKGKKWTALVQAVDHYLPPLADLLDHFAFVPEWRIDDVMVSYAVPGGSVGAHFDQYDVFLLQGPGQRRWQLGEQCNDQTPRLEHAQLRLIADMPVTFDEVLGPGDLLYVPPGLGHHGVAQTECLTYSVGFRAPSLGHILEQVVDAVLLDRGTEQLYGDAGRTLPAHPAELGLSDVSTLATTLQSWLQQPLLFQTALAPFLSEAKYDDYEPEGEPCTLADLRTALSDGIDLLRDPASRWLWESQTQTFWRNGEVVSVPDAVKPHLPALLTGRRHAAAKLAALPEAVLSWLADDISAGFWLPVDGADANEDGAALMLIHELAWTDSPEAALAAVRDLPWPLLLDSQDAGRWDILVAAPRAHSWQTGQGWQHAHWPATSLAPDADAFAVMQALQDWGGPELPRAEPAQDWPFVNGVMGCLGYASASERGLPTPRHDDWPLAILAYYDQGCVWDHEQRRCFAWSLNAQTWPAWLARLQAAAPSACQPLQLQTPFQALTQQPRYAADIARIHDFIRAGDCYQVNYTQAYEARSTGELWDAYSTLRPLALAPYAAYWRLPWGEILCLSPEQFLGIHQQRITTRPIKGTRRRQADASADAAEASALLASAKDMAENIMITDLLRNDLSKHAVIGSVQVPQLCALESFGQVHHLVTTIEATLAADANVASVLRDAFPGGSITGAPKKRVMEIIEDLEPTPRGLYCGSLFYWDASGHFDSNITIRTLVLKDGTLRTWAGGGITLDSQWQSEWEECGNKMGGIMRALEQR